MERIKTAVIGYGKVARYHAAALLALPESEFIAVCGRDLGKATAFAASIGPGIRAYDDVTEMIRDAGVQAVVVCTPHPAHADPAIAAARAGAHVLVEKPLAATLADCDAMIRAARESGVLLGGVCQRRFYRPVQRVRQAIDEGRIGHPILGTIEMLGWRDEAYYRSDPWRGSWAGEGGGVLVNQAPHQLDLLQWYMGPVEEVYGIWGNLNHPYIEVEDTAVAVIRFQNGGIGNVLVTNAVNPAQHGNVHIYGENGAAVGVQTDGGAMFIAGMTGITEPPVNDLWTVPGEENLLAGWRQGDADFFNGIDAVNHYYERQDEDFLRAVQTGGRPLIDGEEARKTVELFEAIYRTTRDRAPVRFPLVPGERE